MSEIPYIRFDPDNKSTWPPFMTQCVAVWLENAQPRFSACAAFGFGGWYDVKKSKSGRIIQKELIDFDPYSLGWCELMPPNWWTGKNKGDIEK